MSKSVNSTYEDHALESVPLNERRSWLKLSWNTVGIVTTLVALYIGALLTFVAGVRGAILAGVTVACLSWALGWAVGHVAYVTGQPSGLLARRHGFGIQGSTIISAVFGFMMIGFLAAENLLLYQVILLHFEAADTWPMRIIVYGALAGGWTFLTAYGFDTVSRFSSLMLIGFLAMLTYLLVSIVDQTQPSWAAATTFGTQLTASELARLGIASEQDKIVFCINVLSGSGGALALLAADLGRYARRSSDVGVAMGLGAVTCCVGMVAAGGVMMYASVPLLAAHGYPAQSALSNPEKVAAAFILIGGGLGAAFVIAAQSKAQVINTYSSALSLTNISDSLFGWRPGRVTFVVIANLLSLLLLGGELLQWFNAFLETLGILTACFASVIIADYLIVRRGFTSTPATESVNRAGMITIAVAVVMSQYVLDALIPIRMVSVVLTVFFVYPLLRIFVLPGKPA